MNNDMDAQFLCKDCARFNLCKYYDRRKEDSYICKYFHLTETYRMTNGEVIQALFPNLDNANDPGYFSKVRNMEGHFIKTDKEFWNAPYKKGGEE